MAIAAIAIIGLGWRVRAPMMRVVCGLAFLGYLVGVAGVTMFPIVTEPGFIDQMRQANQLSDGINLVPLAGFGEIDGVVSRQLMLNVLLGVPFGLALPFLGARSARRIVALGLVFAVTIELIQLAIDAAYQFGYRTVDVNDVITNVAGVMVGVGSFRLLQLAYRAMKFDAQDVGSYLDTVLSAR